MARLNIDTGTAGNSATGDTLRTAMTKINTNFEDVYLLIGDPSKAKNKLSWTPKVTFRELVKIMVNADWEKVKRMDY